MLQAIVVKHNIEMAHRLWDLPGKCEQIHGHSWWCELTMWRRPDPRGIIIDFGEVKKAFREYLDGTFDHRLALDDNDPLLQYGNESVYPGLVRVPSMPTVENMSKWIGQWTEKAFPGMERYTIHLWEAATNAAVWES
jgi:6-pyruvoyltetrahydropterin/6-carboxytetrahydropterin synthase